MDFDTQQYDGSAEDGSWLDDIGDFFSDIGDSITDFFTSDVPELADGGDALAGMDAGTVDPGSSGDLPNDGFYQSLPGMDSVTGGVLDQTYQLIDEINDFGEETFGEQEWDEALVLAQSDPYGLAEGIETPSELQARFAHDDAQREASFREWQDRQEAIGDADAEITEAGRLTNESDWMLWNTDQLLNL